MTINYLIPTEEIFDVIAEYQQKFDDMGIKTTDRVAFVISTFFDNAELMANHHIDAWLQFGGCLPAVEWVIAQQNGESEAEFYARTQYPKQVVEAYSIPNNDFGTLVFANQYKQYHLAKIPANTTVWELNANQGLFIDLAMFDNRLRGI